MQPITQEDIVKIQPKGLLTIPKKFREELGIKEDSFVRVIKVQRRLIIEPARVLSYPGRSYSESELEEFFDFDKKETYELKKKGLV